LEYEEHSVVSLSFNYEGSDLAAAYFDKKIVVYSFSGNEKKSILETTEIITCVRFHPLRNQTLVSGSKQGNILVWNLKYFE
jgi:WD40 repeat protein